jgi:acetyl-CoA carboxylase carboxyl transferase subunit beta
MSWLNRVRNAIASVTKNESPDNLWHKCPGCGQMVFTKEYEENLSVCPSCEHHGRIGARTRFRQVFDDGKFTLLPSPRAPEDPLRFRDSKKYIDRLKVARAATNEPDALLNARGPIGGHEAIVSVQDFAFMGGSMGVGVGEAFIAGIRAAIAERLPYIIFTASGGARMQEGILSLMQMPRMTVAVAELKEAGLPYIVVLTDPTSGGVMASYALIGDVHLAEPKATLAFTGRRVIENTIREKLPEGFQTSEYLLDHGMLDMIVEREDLPAMLARLLGYLAPVKAAA